MADNEIVTRLGQMSTVTPPRLSTAISESMSHAAIRIRRVAGRPGESSMPTTSALTCGVRAAVATLEVSVLGAAGSHLFPSRTQQLSPPAPKILGTSVPGKIGQGRDQTTSTRER